MHSPLRLLNCIVDLLHKLSLSLAAAAAHLTIYCGLSRKKVFEAIQSKKGKEKRWGRKERRNKLLGKVKS